MKGRKSTRILKWFDQSPNRQRKKILIDTSIDQEGRNLLSSIRVLIDAKQDPDRYFIRTEGKKSPKFDQSPDRPQKGS